MKRPHGDAGPASDGLIPRMATVVIRSPQNAERSAIAFAKHHVADADAGGLADALALALYFRRYRQLSSDPT